MIDPGPGAALADRIEKGEVYPCCLLEENLYVEEREIGHKLVRVCRSCHRRHIRMRAEPGRFYKRDFGGR